jgi:para-aminobenzoate synthetase
VELRTRRIDGDRDAELAFERLYGGRRDAFWLDSSRVGESARFSFIGAPGPLGDSLTHAVGEGESIFDRLAAELDRMRVSSPELPFGFNCGFVGWFGYELKGETGGRAAHLAPTPDAAFLFVDRLVAFDHEDGRTYVLCLVEPGAEEAEHWLGQTAALLEALPPSQGEPERIEAGGEPLELHLDRTADRYIEDIAACKRALREGESYEICLTNQVFAEVAEEPLSIYKRLRRVNPAPYAAYLRIGETSVLSSSPERFLRIGADGAVEAKPIKGTSRRDEDVDEDARLAAALHADPKNRAENLMIVDLLRNDLGRVCEVGSVEVPRLMEVESFETVHQLVSTIRGRLRSGVGPLDCVRACFPPGSMTGAPKERTMEIIDQLEGAARGVYSGAIGYLGLGGECDLAVAIRTVVLDGSGGASVGAGGAIVIGSDPAAELEEMLLKAWAPLRALDPGLPADYSRVRLSDSIPRVMPRKSTTSDATSTTRA